jgi:sulfonate transport system substrate-binding protein
MTSLTRRAALAALISGVALATAGNAAADPAKTITLDYAYYNPVSLVLKDKGWLEQEFAKDGISVRWVLSLGSNKAIEFLNARSIDFGSTAGAAALLAKINGSPITSIYVYSKPEWTALVTRKDSPIQTVADLKGKRVAVTRGTDPYIFLLRALAQHGLGERDIKPVLLQHQDGRTALEQGQVDAWAGLDPMMAQTEVEQGSRLFFRNADLNTYGFLNVREAFAADNPEITRRVLAVYEKGRRWAIENQAALRGTLASAAKLSDAVAAKQLERTDLSNPVIGPVHRNAILAAGIALQESGVIPSNVAVKDVVDALIDPRFARTLAQATR